MPEGWPRIEQAHYCYSRQIVSMISEVLQIMQSSFLGPGNCKGNPPLLHSSYQPGAKGDQNSGSVETWGRLFYDECVAIAAMRVARNQATA